MSWLLFLALASVLASVFAHAFGPCLCVWPLLTPVTTHVFVCLFVGLSVSPSVRLSICRSDCPSFCFGCLFVCSVCPFLVPLVSMSVCLCVRPVICLFHSASLLVFLCCLLATFGLDPSCVSSAMQCLVATRGCGRVRDTERIVTAGASAGASRLSRRRLICYVVVVVRSLAPTHRQRDRQLKLSGECEKMFVGRSLE